MRLTRRTVSWVRRNPAAAAGFLIGVTIGTAFCAPLIGWQLSDSSATILGAFLGAALAVYFALFVARRQDDEKEERLYKTLLSVLVRARSEVQAVDFLEQKSTHPAHCHENIHKLRQVVTNARSAAVRISEQGLVSLESEDTIQRLIQLESVVAEHASKYQNAISGDAQMKIGKEVLRNVADNLEQEFDYLIERIKYRDVEFVPAQDGTGEK